MGRLQPSLSSNPLQTLAAIRKINIDFMLDKAAMIECVCVCVCVDVRFLELSAEDALSQPDDHGTGKTELKGGLEADISPQYESTTASLHLTNACRMEEIYSTNCCGVHPAPIFAFKKGGAGHVEGGIARNAYAIPLHVYVCVIARIEISNVKKSRWSLSSSGTTSADLFLGGHRKGSSLIMVYVRRNTQYKKTISM